ncbi:MAG: hypothetical protein JXR88_08195 [Clostridia bacterium]|nr:hypothetical protein [Clostridia bacterium]
MLYFLGAGLLVVAGVGIYFFNQQEETYDIVEDFKSIKTAMRAFRNENIGLTKGIENLAPYLPKGHTVKLDRYLVSIDDKFLVVKKLPRGIDPNEIVKKIGGQSKYSDGFLKLSFFTLSNSVEPTAVIRIKPMANITTKTQIEYSHEESITDNNEILKVEWENNEEYFEEEGVHVIKLRVMDKHFRWSEWEQLEIFVSEAKGVKGLAGSSGHIMVIHNNGFVDAYGDNSFGQLGNCTNQNNVKLEPLVQLKLVEEIAIGDYHTLFMKSDGRVFASGKNDFGQLGIGNRNNSKIPKLTWGIDNIKHVACGNGFSAAVTTDGFVYTWGQNEYGCLGHTNSHFADRPVKLNDIENIQSISLGKNYMMALNYDGTVKGWGTNDNGELGLGFKSKNNEPTITLLKGIKQLACGNGFTFALTNNGKVLGVGNNKNHQLGYDGEKTILFPQEISGLKDIKKIVTSGDHTLALDETGNVYSWGQFSPVNDDFAIKPEKSDELKYIKDIAVTLNKGYVLTDEGEVYEFSNRFSQMIKLEKAEARIEQYEEE